MNKRSINIVFEGEEDIKIEPIGEVTVPDLLRGLFALTELFSENSELNKVEVAEQLVIQMKSESSVTISKEK